VVFVHDFKNVPRAGEISARSSRSVWAACLAFVGFAYAFQFSVVHPYIDMRACVSQLPDPLFTVVAYNPRWYLVSHELFYLASVVGIGALLVQAARGDHRPVLRFGVGIAFQALFRSLTMWLLPLCKVTVLPGRPALSSVPTIALGPLHVPWRAWATNDLVFSGHVAEFLILSLAVRWSWPRPARWTLAAFQVLQAIALISTRGHYTVDLIIAVPFAVCADRLAVWLLAPRHMRRAAA
jgi:hypothetical protein